MCSVADTERETILEVLDDCLGVADLGLCLVVELHFEELLVSFLHELSPLKMTS